jgi:hypothetical protein
MIGSQTFFPARLPGLLFHGAVLFFLAAAGAFSMWRAANAELGISFFLFFLPLLIVFSLIPLFVYRMQALRKSSYILERDGFRLQWGLRLEVISMNQVMWVRLAEEGQQPISLPLVRWPGSVMGKRISPNGIPVEFFASNSSSLVLIAVSDRIFAISPEDPAAFLSAYQRVMELGSLTPLAPASIYPSFLLGRFWADRLVRILVSIGGALSLVLIAWVLLMVPTRPEVFLRADIPGTGPVPSVRLLLLPMLSSVFYGADLLSGLYLYRQAENRNDGLNIQASLAYLLLGSGALVPLLFLGAVAFILSAG